MTADAGKGMTVGAFKVELARRLQAADIPDASMTARQVIARVLGVEIGDLMAREDDLLTDQEIGRANWLADRMISGVPSTDVLGFTDFMTIQLTSDHRALSPRPDSERIVEAALSVTASQSKGHILDLGTGSGCLLLSFLAERPDWRGTGLDLSNAALTLAKENADQLGLSMRSRFIHGDWSAAAPELAQADIIISNPPYIPTAVVAGLSESVRRNDPHMALDGGQDGLAAYRDILQLCARYARAETPVIFEMGFDQLEPLSALVAEAGYRVEQVIHDYGGHHRGLIIQKS